MRTGGVGMRRRSILGVTESAAGTRFTRCNVLSVPSSMLSGCTRRVLGGGRAVGGLIDHIMRIGLTTTLGTRIALRGGGISVRRFGGVFRWAFN